MKGVDYHSPAVQGWLQDSKHGPKNPRPKTLAEENSLTEQALAKFAPPPRRNVLRSMVFFEMKCMSHLCEKTSG